MGRTCALLVVAMVVIALAASACVPPRPPHGGPDVFRSTGFLRTAYDGHRWWLVTPAGRPFSSTGIDHVAPRATTPTA
ncbi:MAG TPA: hypothetical protein VIB48_24630 [Acidimicrobiia bacterium]